MKYRSWPGRRAAERAGNARGLRAVVWAVTAAVAVAGLGPGAAAYGDAAPHLAPRLGEIAVPDCPHPSVLADWRGVSLGAVPLGRSLRTPVAGGELAGVFSGNAAGSQLRYRRAPLSQETRGMPVSALIAGDALRLPQGTAQVPYQLTLRLPHAQRVRFALAGPAGALRAVALTASGAGKPVKLGMRTLAPATVPIGTPPPATSAAGAANASRSATPASTARSASTPSAPSATAAPTSAASGADVWSQTAVDTLSLSVAGGDSGAFALSKLLGCDALPAHAALPRHATGKGQALRGLRARRAGTGTELLNETFQGGSAPDPDLLPLNSACLTGAAAGSTPPAGASALGPCASSNSAPAAGTTPGYLQLTDNSNNASGGVLYNKPLPGNAGLVAEFETYQYGGSGADGISFFLTDGAAQLTTAGAPGGALGYAAINGYADGVHAGYLGVGFDAYGNYNIAALGGGCPTRPNENQVINAVGIRGPGEGRNGYCYLAGTIPAQGVASTLPGVLRGTTVADAVRRTRVTVSPDTLPTVTVEIDFNDGRGYRTILSHTMTTPVPATYKFGFAAGTGQFTDVHLIRNVAISTVTPLSRLNLVKQVDKTQPQPASYTIGQSVPYQFLLTNSGAQPLTNAAVTDPHVAPVTCPRTTLGAAGTAGASMVCTGTHTLTAADTSPDGTFTNTATATATDPGGADVPSNPSSAKVNIAGVPILTFTKTSDAETPAKPGDKITYTVTAANTGSADYPGVTFTDDLTGVLDDAAYGSDATATSGTAAYTAPKLTWTGDVAAGHTVTITYSVTVKNPDTGDHTLANAVVGPEDSNCPPGSTDPACTTSGSVAALKLTKTSDAKTPAKPGDKITYTVTAANTGKADYPGATFTDDLTKVIDDAAYNADATTTSGTVAYAAPKLTWTGDVAVGQTVTITYSVTVRSPGTGDHLLTNAVVGPEDSNCPPGSTDPACTTGTNVAELQLTKTMSPSGPKPGDTVTYTITATDTGKAPYKGASWTDDLTKALDDATYNQDAKATAGTTAYTAPTLSWTGDLAAGQSATTVYTVTVHNPVTGDTVLSNTVVGPPDSNCAPGSTDPACTPDGGRMPNPVIKKTTDTPKPLPGGKVGYTVTVTNIGSAPYTGSLTDNLSGVIDDATWNGDQKTTAGTVAYKAPTLTWHGTLAPHQSATITYSVTVATPPKGNKNLHNQVTGSSTSNCPLPMQRSRRAAALDPDCYTNAPLPTVQVSKTMTPTNPKEGGTVTYTLTLANHSKADYPGLTLSDDLTKVLDDATYNQDAKATTGTATYTAPTLHWTGTVRAGTTTKITYTVTVRKPDNGNRRLDNTVTVPGGSNCAKGSTDPECSTHGKILPPAKPDTDLAKTGNDLPLGRTALAVALLTGTGVLTTTIATRRRRQ